MKRTRHLRIESAPHERTEELRFWCRSILEILGALGAFITDHSTIGDFAGLDFDHDAKQIDEDAWRRRLEACHRRLGVDVAEGDLVCEVASRLKARLDAALAKLLEKSQEDGFYEPPGTVREDADDTAPPTS
jgi:hypothetical protein